MRFTILTICFILCTFSAADLQAQELLQGHCGVTYEEGLSIREQLFRNRANVDRNALSALQSRRFTLWIPLVIHLVGNTQGQGFASPSGAVSMVCKLNQDFADQNIQFYIKDSIHYLKNDIIYVDAYDSIAIDQMILAKDTTAANIFINGAAGGGVAGYYSRRGDYVFILSGYANGGSTTITHEFGHFFTLPHTFFGWEGTDARALYHSSPAPDSILDSHGTKREVEYVARSGPQANCYSSADGFCDTDADYISDRVACPMPGNALDPSGVPIAPNPHLYMSYFLDNCMDSFSAEQKVAILTDVVDRNWTGFPAPNATAVSGAAIAALSPADSSLQSMGQTFIHFEWSTTGATAADAWIIEVERMLFGTPVGTVVRTIVNNQNYLDLPINKFMQNTLYRWRVMPFSSGYPCASFSVYKIFNTDMPSATTLLDKNDMNSDFATVTVMPNPVYGNTVTIRLSILQPLQGALRLYAADGRLISEEKLQSFPIGDSVQKLDVTGLSAGMYRLVFLSDKGAVSNAIVLYK